MKKIFKWIGITLGSLIVLVILALIIVPLFIDIQKFKPTIEQQVTKATGRPFTIGGDLKLSLFPLAGIAFSDVHLGNPEGFTEKDFVSVKSLDVKVKFMPLLSKDVQVKRFIIEGPRIVLEKTKDGKAGWQGLGKKDSAVIPEEEKTQEDSGLPIKGLTVAEFSVSKGELLYIDHASGMRKEVKDLRIELKDVSLEKPLKLSISAIADGKTVSIEGEAGPIGSEPGRGTMDVNLAVTAMNMLSITVEGSATDVASKPQFDLNISADSFSPRDLINGLKPDLKLKTKDPEVLKTMSARMKIKGSTGNIDISDGTIELDQSRMTFSATAKDFSKPDLTFKMVLDKIDADRYLPPVEEKQADGAQTPNTPQKEEKIDYSPLRKLVLDGALNIGELTIKGFQIRNIQANVKGKNGVFNMAPFSLKAYEGGIAGNAALDVSGDTPAIKASVDINKLQVRKLVSDLIKKDIIEGAATGSISLSMYGDNSALIKKTLNGKGDFTLKDGAIVGIDLPGMINNLKTAFGTAQAAETTERTDFSEFIIPFDIKNGVINTQNTSLVSPALRIKAKGNADLTKDSLDFRIEPTFVKTLKGQGDTKERGGYTVPVLVKGTFTEPKFSPDLSGLLEKSLEKGIDKLLKDKTGEDGESGSTKDAVKGFLKGILGK